MLFTVVKSVALFERSSYPESPAGCTAVSARSRLAFTDVSSLVSSIEPETIEAEICCPVSVKSISELSDMVTSPVFVPLVLPMTVSCASET